MGASRSGLWSVSLCVAGPVRSQSRQGSPTGAGRELVLMREATSITVVCPMPGKPESGNINLNIDISR